MENTRTQIALNQQTLEAVKEWLEHDADRNRNYWDAATRLRTETAMRPLARRIIQEIARAVTESGG